MLSFFKYYKWPSRQDAGIWCQSQPLVILQCIKYQWRAPEATYNFFFCSCMCVCMLVCLPIHCKVLSSMQALSPLKHFNFSLQTSNSTRIALWFIIVIHHALEQVDVCATCFLQQHERTSVCAQWLWTVLLGKITFGAKQPHSATSAIKFHFHFVCAVVFVLMCMLLCAYFLYFLLLDRHFSSGYFTVHKALSSVKTNRAIYKLCVINFLFLF